MFEDAFTVEQLNLGRAEFQGEHLASSPRQGTPDTRRASVDWRCCSSSFGQLRGPAQCPASVPIPRLHWLTGLSAVSSRDRLRPSAIPGPRAGPAGQTAQHVPRLRSQPAGQTAQHVASL